MIRQNCTETVTQRGDRTELRVVEPRIGDALHGNAVAASGQEVHNHEDLMFDFRDTPDVCRTIIGTTEDAIVEVIKDARRRHVG